MTKQIHTYQPGEELAEQLDVGYSTVCKAAKTGRPILDYYVERTKLTAAKRESMGLVGSNLQYVYRVARDPDTGRIVKPNGDRSKSLQGRLDELAEERDTHQSFDPSPEVEQLDRELHAEYLRSQFAEQTAKMRARFDDLAATHARLRDDLRGELRKAIESARIELRDLADALVEEMQERGSQAATERGPVTPELRQAIIDIATCDVHDVEMLQIAQQELLNQLLSTAL